MLTYGMLHVDLGKLHVDLGDDEGIDLGDGEVVALLEDRLGLGEREREAWVLLPHAITHHSTLQVQGYLAHTKPPLPRTLQ
jgi:hypothetical protein